MLVLPQDSNYSGELQCHCHPKKQEIFLNELPEIQKQVRRKKKLNKRGNNGRNKGEGGRKMGGGIRGEKENKTKHVIQSNGCFVYLFGDVVLSTEDRVVTTKLVSTLTNDCLLQMLKAMKCLNNIFTK